MSRNWRHLHDALRSALGSAVRFDTAHKAVYASDASNYRQVPIGVVVPRSVDEFVRGVAICHENRAPLLVRGAGTSMSGQTVNEAVVFDLSVACSRILEVDPASKTALVEPGVVCDTLRSAAEHHGLTFAPDPSTHSRCTLGGMIGNNSCGAHSVMAGKTLENVRALEIMTYDGERFWVGPTTEQEIDRIVHAGGRKGQIYRDLRDLRDRYADQIRKRFPSIKRRVSGFNLDQLLPENGFNLARALVGTEGTCALILKASLDLVSSPPHRVLLVLGFDDIYLAADAVPEYERFRPIAVEGLDRMIIRGLQARNLAQAEIDLLPPGDAWVVLEFGADVEIQASEQAERAAAYFRARPGGPRPTTRIVTDRAMQQRIWSIRENGASATQLSIDPDVPDPQVGWEDAAVDPHRLGDYLRAFNALVARYGYRTSLFGHFGDGCVHARITFDLRTKQGVERYRSFVREASELVVAFGGSLSGEHGDGQAKGEFLPIMFGDELTDAMRQFKRIWDPDGLLNPGKVVDAYRVDENLRAGPDYKVVPISTHMTFRSQEGDGFQRAVERCVGMGKCRAAKGGTMCPSFRATGEERYSTRGRARLLWEMLQGKVVRDGWKSEAVKEALDTCLSCKGCRSDCPTHTDMATYKAEFLSHYYEQKSRPRQAWSMGRIGDWAPLAAAAPRFTNFMTNAPLLASVSKWVAGVASDRTPPKFAEIGFRRLFLSDQVAAPGDKMPVILWLDTFCDNFQPEVAKAAVAVLRDAGFEPILPTRRLCCGRPLYDFGYLELAKRRLQDVVDVLSPMLDAERERPLGIVGLEPGCLSVFKDELPKLFPNDPRAQRISRSVFLLGDFLLEHDYKPPSVEVDVLVHTHCHQKSLFGNRGDVAMLERAGTRTMWLDSGCCGMAGSFGFNPDHAELSRNVAELVLAPNVRKQLAGTVIMTNGFSCREQVKHMTGRTAMHLAQVLAMGLPRTNAVIKHRQESESVAPNGIESAL
ncbi:FAD-binding and (Fe-S)-binding domain-containing protein [Bradyrhizobium sp. Ash2021]|uniref:FAD-binding and (Fe-S)-binding domain-containing protein n=1 Tax=Bradyrhizobium sp. Ash2021 TaxID=2954771 RepID=UPI00281605CD|nr:FAD-binding and (Fe-S)-binding domain-containing protein [Bradyrhizobium sp. Ash2021]WMT76354.1 FAD-binding oxidoreductase [Bradyrhizobium sp. Ash2021]